MKPLPAPLKGDELLALEYAADRIALLRAWRPSHVQLGLDAAGTVIEQLTIATRKTANGRLTASGGKLRPVKHSTNLNIEQPRRISMSIRPSCVTRSLRAPILTARRGFARHSPSGPHLPKRE
jgi:hypothetical protein